MNEASDFIAAFNAEPTQFGQCSLCIEIEDCVFDGDGAAGHIHIDEEMTKWIDGCFLSTPIATPSDSVDPLTKLMEAQPDEQYNEDGTLTLAAQQLLAGYEDCDSAMAMEPIDDVSNSVVEMMSNSTMFTECPHWAFAPPQDNTEWEQLHRKFHQACNSLKV